MVPSVCVKVLVWKLCITDSGTLTGMCDQDLALPCKKSPKAPPEICVIKTNYRPVPLHHYLWAGLKLHKVMEGSAGSGGGIFLEKGYKEASGIH